MPLPQHEDYTTEYIYHLPEGTRAELIDGQIYYMAPPTRTHQKLLFSISRTIADYIDSKKGICEVDIAPFAVFLNEDNRNYVEPDISVICDTEKLSEKGCTGAPDWIDPMSFFFCSSSLDCFAIIIRIDVKCQHLFSIFFNFLFFCFFSTFYTFLRHFFFSETFLYIETSL